MQDKNIFLVLGMARSGTSAITRALSAAGVDLGHALTPGDVWNPKGFFEDNEIVYDINAKVFTALNFQPYGIHTLSKEQLEDLQLEPIKQTASDIITHRFSTTSNWAFKDPSTIKLLPFWQDVFHKIKINEHYVIALRNPLSVAQSYSTLTGLNQESVLILWLMHLVQAINGTQNKHRMIVSYEDVVDYPVEELERIRKFFNFPALASDAVASFANEFLEKSLRHHSNTDDALLTDPALKAVPLCLKVYTLLKKIAKDEMSFRDLAFASEWQQINDELEAVYPVYCYVDTLLKKINRLERNIKAIHKSRSWKLLYVVRKIDDLIRSYRRKSRTVKRINKAYG